MVFIRSTLTTFVIGTALTLLNTVHAFQVYTECKPGHFALTYDDGPYEFTRELLNLLETEGVKATFFINGNNFWGDLNENSEGLSVIQKAFSGGHQVASHTYSHAHLTSLSEEGIVSEITKVEDIIAKATGGFKPTCLRPPYGEYNDFVLQVLDAKGYRVVNWNIDTKDFESHNLEEELKHVDVNSLDVSQGYISLSHDVYQQTTTELTRELIKLVKEKGFQFATVAQCLGVEPYRK